MDATEERVELELMWEGVECFCGVYANPWSYLDKMKEWYSYVETTYLLDTRGRSVRAYYERREMQLASEAALPALLSQDWVERFITHSRALLAESESFVAEAHLRSSDMDRERLIDRLKRGTDLMYEVFATFEVTQPQYSWELEPHLFSLLPGISNDDKHHIMAVLAQSAEPTLLSEEEDAWAILVTRLRDKNPSLPSQLHADVVQFLDDHARTYGLVHAADANPPADRESLYERLAADWSRTNLIKDRTAERAALTAEQDALIKEYDVSDEAVRICTTLARLSHIRLETRLRGWMPLVKIVENELIPELTRFLPYTADQLESCTRDELYALIDGAPMPTQKELDERRHHAVVGLYKGEMVLWVGKEADEKLAPLLPIIDYDAKEIMGQSAMKGKTQGPCYIVNWDVEASAQEVEKMPQGAVLVAGQTRPQLMGFIKKAAAIVTDEGGVLSHAAIVSRELRIPCIIGTKYATKILKTGDMVEVDANKGIVRKL